MLHKFYMQSSIDVSCSALERFVWELLHAGLLLSATAVLHGACSSQCTRCCTALHGAGLFPLSKLMPCFIVAQNVHTTCGRCYPSSSEAASAENSASSCYVVSSCTSCFAASSYFSQSCVSLRRQPAPRASCCWKVTNRSASKWPAQCTHSWQYNAPSCVDEFASSRIQARSGQA